MSERIQAAEVVGVGNQFWPPFGELTINKRSDLLPTIQDRLTRTLAPFALTAAVIKKILSSLDVSLLLERLQLQQP